MRPTKAHSRAFLAIALVSLVIFSGCATGPGDDISKLARGIPDVNAFLAEHPNANISAVLWSEEMTAANIDMLREKCGKRMEIQEYWYVIVETAVPPKKIEIWINPPTKATVCIKKTGIDTGPVDECSTDAECDDGMDSTRDVCQGTPKKCIHHKINECTSGDGYCPPQCSYAEDNDCPAVDTCSADAECDDGSACTVDMCAGIPKACSNTAVSSCSSGDGCCPSGCSYAVDADCPLVDECSTNTNCIDGDNCTYDICSGTPKVCSHPAITECVAGDSCCPGNCDANTDADCGIDLCSTDDDCADNSDATRDVCSGTPKRCYHYAITECVSGDNYCPSGCTHDTDDDCQITNLCDTNAECADADACTIDTCSGTPSACLHMIITACTSGDGCCPSACVPLTDDDCEGCVSDVECTSTTSCTESSCVDGVCTYTNLADGTTCAVDSECVSGVCTEIDLCTGVDCDDGDPCTVDGCEDGVCSHTAAADGTSCGTNKSCVSGECNTHPVANAGADQSVDEGESVTLDGSASSDSDGSIVSYEWKEGATVLSTDVSFTKSNFSAGAHTVTLTVTDDDSATDSDNVIVSVSAAPTGDLCDGQSGWVKTGELAGAKNTYDFVQTSDGTIYAATGWNGDVFKTTDGGLTWENTADIPNETGAFALVLTHDEIIYVGTSPHGKVLKSIDGGQSWVEMGNLEINSPPPSTGLGAVYDLIQASDGVFYAGVAYTGEIFKSTDSGATWVSKGPIGTVLVYSLFEASDGTLYAGNDSAKVFKSVDDGETWVSTGGPGGTVRGLVETSDGKMLAGEMDIFRYEGGAWINKGLGERVTSSLIRAHNGIIYAGTDGEVYKSIDNGETWIGTNLNETEPVLGLFEAADGSIYAGLGFGHGVYRYCQ